MDTLFIIYIDDQREVLSTLEKDLELFEEFVTIEECESAIEAHKLINEIDSKGGMIAVIISDHVMPRKSGIEFLSDINSDARFVKTKKILLTGQATHKDIIDAINKAHIEKYIEKPWNSNDLIEAVKILLTEYILSVGIDYSKYSKILHQPTLLNKLHKSS